jgi:hypothetical protein
MTLVDTVQQVYTDGCRRNPRGGGCTVRVDDRRPDDYYQSFCTISAIVRPDGTATLTLTHPPLNDGVRVVVDNYGGRVLSSPVPAIDLELPPTDDAAGIVRDLAAAIKAVTRRGQHYPEKNWKWIVPRTAGSLIRFARVLTRHHRASCRTHSRPHPTSREGVSDQVAEADTPFPTSR